MIRRTASTRNHAREEARTAGQAYSMIQRDLEATRNKVIMKNDAPMHVCNAIHSRRGEEPFAPGRRRVDSAGEDAPERCSPSRSAPQRRSRPHPPIVRSDLTTPLDAVTLI